MKIKHVRSIEKEPDGYAVATDYGWAFFASDDLGTAEHLHIFQTQKEVRENTRHLQHCSCLRCISKGELA